MKPLFRSLLLTFCATAVLHADIQQPPSSDQGPTRKFGRGLSNMLFAPTELVNNIAVINDEEGNSAAGGYGVFRGVARMFTRVGAGIYEVVTAPFPTNKGKYTPILRNDVPWIHSGFEEFPPELGWESRYDYARQ
jgi:putative exosortase-associated protein (TIGR04073 family)